MRISHFVPNNSCCGNGIHTRIKLIFHVAIGQIFAFTRQTHSRQAHPTTPTTKNHPVTVRAGLNCVQNVFMQFSANKRASDKSVFSPFTHHRYCEKTQRLCTFAAAAAAFPQMCKCQPTHRKTAACKLRAVTFTQCVCPCASVCVCVLYCIVCRSTAHVHKQSARRRRRRRRRSPVRQPGPHIMNNDYRVCLCVASPRKTR